MSKQKVNNKDQIIESWHQLTASHIGAWALTGLAMLSALELAMEHHPALNPAAGHGSNSIAEQYSRAEGRSESARLPEEFDIGLQTPPIAGL